MDSVESAACSVGVGFKPQHVNDIANAPGCVGMFEVHAENYMSAGGARMAELERIRRDYPLSLHGVGLSLGGFDPVDRQHLARVSRVIDRFQPDLFSEHLAWSSHAGRYFGDLLPLPYTSQTLHRVASNIEMVQDALKRRILLENPATYCRFEDSPFSETEFLSRIAELTGCGLLLDVSNVFVCACNHSFDPDAYIDAFPISAVEEIHLAGYAESRNEDGDLLLIDAHNSAVTDPVWRLYERVLAKRGPVRTVIEWDNDVPEWGTLVNEAQSARTILENARTFAAPSRGHA
jgi:uncharacterized protein